MTGLFRSEWLKLRTTRTAVVLAFGLLLVTTIATVGSLVSDDQYLSGFQQDLPSSAGFCVLFAILFGILVMTGEFRHGTATPTFLVSPLRERVVAAKAIASVAGGATLALAALLLLYVISLIWLALARAPSISSRGSRCASRSSSWPRLQSGALWGSGSVPSFAARSALSSGRSSTS